MATEENGILSVDLGTNGGRLVFFSIDDIERWVNREVDYWKWLGQGSRIDAGVGEIYSQQAQPWQRIINEVRNYKAVDENAKPRNLAQISGIMKETYGKLISLASTAPAAKLIKTYDNGVGDELGTLTACYLLGIFIRVYPRGMQSLPRNSIAISRATIAHFLFTENIKGKRLAETESLDDLKQQFDNTLNQTKAALHDAEHSLTGWKIESDGVIKAIKSTADSFISEGKKDLKEITETYDQKLALQSSVSYWKKKADHHKDLARWFTGAFVIVLLVFGVAIAGEIKGVLGSLPDTAKPQEWEVGLILLSAGVAIWIVRMIARVLLSHIQLERDASERVTMIQTYLAMLREGTGPEKDHKLLILQTLFRPSTTGLIKDEGLPSLMWENLTKPQTGK